MSSTLLAWLLTFSGLTIKSLQRPIWGLGVYYIAFFAAPQYWSWGGPIKGYRWAFISGLILIISVLLMKILGRSKVKESGIPRAKIVNVFANLMLLNILFVHFFLAEKQAVSSEMFSLFAKFILLYYLIVMAVETKNEFSLLLLILVIGASYIGYETTINDVGKITKGRLEGVGAPGAGMSNQLACLMVSILPLAGSLFMISKGKRKILVAIVTPLILNVIMLTNSRGAMLAAIASGIIFLIFSPREVRKQSIFLLSLGSLATFMLMGDDRIIERFMSIFVEEEERDGSASSRIVYWQAGMNVIKDYPLGSGGNGFKTIHASEYLQEFGIYVRGRSVHNGFINEACEWGIQGLCLKFLFMLSGIFASGKAAKYQKSLGNRDPIILRIGIISGLAAYLVTCMFGDFMDAEWGYWLVALLACHANVYGKPSAEDEGEHIETKEQLLPEEVPLVNDKVLVPNY